MSLWRLLLQLAFKRSVSAWAVRSPLSKVCAVSAFVSGRPTAEEARSQSTVYGTMQKEKFS